jgi:hypothetical protein
VQYIQQVKRKSFSQYLFSIFVMIFCSFSDSVLVSACHTDLGDANEAASGYYARSWNWDTISHNAKWIVQFHSDDDPLVPVEEGRFIAEKIHSEYHELTDMSHFFEPFDEIVSVLKEKLGKK